MLIDGIRRKNRMVLLVATSAVVVSLLGGCSAPKKKVDPYKQAASELPAALARAKELGLPMVASDLKRKLPVDPKDNMAVDVRKIQKIVNSDKALKKRLEEFFEMRRNAWDAKNILAKLKTLKNLPDLAFEMSKKPECSFVDDWKSFPWIPFDTYWPPNEINLMLISKGKAEFELGQWEHGQRDLEASARVVKALLEAPREYPFYRTMVDDNRITAGYLRAVRYWQHDVKKLLQIKSRFQSLPPFPPLRHVLDPVFYYSYITDLNQPEYKKAPQFNDFWNHDKPKSILSSGEPKGTIQRALAARNIQSWLLFYDTVSQAKNEVKMLDSFLLLESKDLRDKDPLSVSRPWPLLIAICIEQRLTSTTTRNCIQGLIDVLIFREKNHRLPTSMDEAGCRLVDPYTGTLLRFQVEDNRCMVYSYGPEDSAIARYYADRKQEFKEPKWSHPIRVPCVLN